MLSMVCVACVCYTGLLWDLFALKAKEEEYSRNARPKLLKEIQEAKKHISLLQEQLSKVALQVL